MAWTEAGGDPNLEHPTMKPVALLDTVLETTPFAETVYDPFVGSGTTIIAAERQGRACWAMELEPKYVDASVKRWEDYTGGQAVINRIRQKVYADIHILAERRLLADHRRGWRTAFGFSGPGSSFDRAKEMGRIYDAAAPSISSVMDAATQGFLDQVIRIVGDAVEGTSGSVEGIMKREPALEEARQS